MKRIKSMLTIATCRTASACAISRSKMNLVGSIFLFLKLTEDHLPMVLYK